MTLALHSYQVEARDFQLATANRLGGALLHDEQGSGKTAPSIACLRDKALLVVPACLKLKWKDELAAWRPDLQAIVLDGRGSFRWPRRGEAVITNPDILPPAAAEVEDVAEELAAAKAPDPSLLDLARAPGSEDKLAAKLARLERERAGAHEMPAEETDVLVDEAHEFSNNKAQQTRRLRALRKPVAKTGGRVYPITATVLLNEPLELWNFLTTFGLNRAAYSDWFGFLRAWGGHDGRFGMEWGEPRDHLVAEGLRKVGLRRLFDDVVRNVPPLMPWVTETVDLDSAARAECDEVDRIARERGLDLWRATPEELDGMDSLRRGEGKIAFEMLSRVKTALAAAKLPAAVRVVERFEASGTPWVAAGCAVAPVVALGSRPGCAAITGAEDHETRHAIVKAWRRGDLRGVAFTVRAGGVGIDLFVRAGGPGDVAPYLCLDRDWVPAWNRQGLARVRRQGQTRPTLPILFRGNHPLEDRLDELLIVKRRRMRAVDAAAVRPQGVAA